MLRTNSRRSRVDRRMRPDRVAEWEEEARSDYSTSTDGWRAASDSSLLARSERADPGGRRRCACRCHGGRWTRSDHCRCPSHSLRHAATSWGVGRGSWPQHDLENYRLGRFFAASLTTLDTRCCVRPWQRAHQSSRYRYSRLARAPHRGGRRTQQLLVICVGPPVGT